MPGRAQTTLLACLCTAALGGCGSGDGTIPSDDSAELITLLDAVEENVAGGNCEVAQGQVGEFVTAVNELPSQVDDEVEQGLARAAARLTELSDDPSQCEATTGDSGVDGVEPPPETTTTTEPPLTTETTTETEEQPVPEDGGPPDSPPGQGGTPPGQDNSDGGGPTSGGIGGERAARR